MTANPSDERPAVVGVPAPVRHAIGAALRTSHAPGLSIAMVNSDRVLCAEAFGYADLRAQKKATTSTAYLWFSMSKIVTATAALRLADEGRLDLDAPIVSYLPWLLELHGSPQPRVRQLLNHTAGFANPLPLRWVRPVDAAAPDSREFLTRLLTNHARPKHPIGGDAHYSNLGYLVLAEIVQLAAGSAFEQYVNDAVLRPAGLHRTGYTYRRDAKPATGYLRAPRVATPVIKALLPNGIVGARHHRHLSFRPFLVNGPGYGGLVGDVLDAARLAMLHLADGALDGQRVIAVDTARRMRHINTPGKPFDLGLGWFRPRNQRGHQPNYVEHLGSGGGFNNIMRLYPELNRGIVVMANTTTAPHLQAAFDELIRL
jgi:CubicO group peptidase (beta-lactamase class C family)